MSNAENFRLESDRLILRRPTVEDAEDIFTSYASNSMTTKYLRFEPHEKLDDTIDFINLSNKQWEEKKCYNLVILTKVDGKLIGSVELEIQSDSPDVAKIGYVIAADKCGQGYATEASMRTIEFAKKLGILKLVASIHPDNIAGMRVLEKCGFQEDAGASKTLSKQTNENEKVKYVGLSRSLSMSIPPPNLIWEG